MGLLEKDLTLKSFQKPTETLLVNDVRRQSTNGGEE